MRYLALTLLLCTACAGTHLAPETVPSVLPASTTTATPPAQEPSVTLDPTALAVPCGCLCEPASPPLEREEFRCIGEDEAGNCTLALIFINLRGEE